MKEVPHRLRVSRSGWTPASYGTATGAVYLLRCRVTNEYKFGASTNPHSRIRQLQGLGRWKLARDLEYIWSIATNGVGRLETVWRDRWRKYRIDARREWVMLPLEEVARFRSVTTVVWKDIPEPNSEWFACVQQPYVYPRGKNGQQP